MHDRGGAVSDRPVRSSAWFQASGRSGFIHRAWMRGSGLTDEDFDGRPVIGIASSASDLVPCNLHLTLLAESVKRGILRAGGVPLVFPTLGLGEPVMRPTTMLYRNLAALEIEELLRANPLDGVVLLTGCDKTTPAALMALASVDLPGLLLTGGPMLNGKYRGKDIGAGTFVWQAETDLAAGRLDECGLRTAEAGMVRGPGHCMTMGTASTMACLTEALGMQLPNAAALPAVDARRSVLAERTGARVVELVRHDIRPSQVLTRPAFENAIRTNAALGGSTNAVIHLLAIAGRAGVPLTIAEIDELGSTVPTIANLQPSGTFLMEDFAYAGGLPAVLAEVADQLDLTCATADGRTLGDVVAEAVCDNRDVIRSADDPLLGPDHGIAVLTGNLAPRGAIIKRSAATPALMQHRGRALVFDSIDEYNARFADEDLEVDASTVLIIRGAGPVGYPGMPEVANVPLPPKLVRAGVTDMVRICDGRMSGTGFGTVILHVTPESAVGGPLSRVRTGDTIVVDVAARSLRVDVDDADFAAREPVLPDMSDRVGYEWLYAQHVVQADAGVDFDFLQGGRPAAVPRESH